MLSGGQSSGSSTTNPWGPAGGQLNDILRYAGQLFDQQGGINAEAPKRDTGWIQEGQDFYGGMRGGDFDIGAGDLTGIADELWDAEYEQSMRDAATSDIMQATSMYDTSASGTGTMGSSRVGLQQAGATSDITNQLNQDLMAQRSADLGTALGMTESNIGRQVAGGEGGIGLGREGAEWDYLNEVAEQMGGWDQLQRYLTIVGTIGGMGGSSSTGGSTSGWQGSWGE